MSKPDSSRREFLVRAAVGAGAVAGAGLVPDALAQSHEQDTKAKGEAKPEANAAAHTAQHSPADGHGAFLNHDQATTIAAFAERLMPGAPGKPGASEAGVLNYIDLALAGAYADLQDFYRRGLASLDAYCRKTYNEPFARLSAAQQDETIRALEEGKATGFAWPAAQAFFNLSVVTGLLPNKGLPLPFVSLGGSSLLINLLGMGILLNLSQQASTVAATRVGVDPEV